MSKFNSETAEAKNIWQMQSKQIQLEEAIERKRKRSRKIMNALLIVVAAVIVTASTYQIEWLFAGIVPASLKRFLM